MFKTAKIIFLALIFSSAALADDDWDDRGGYPYYREEIIYAPPVVQYAPPPVVQYVAPPVVEYVPVQPRYYTPPPVSYYGYDQRSPQGLLGGLVGSAIGYEIGQGDPLAAGIGAAAGAWFGNGNF